MSKPDRDTLVRILRDAPADKFMVGYGGAEILADFVRAQWPDAAPRDSSECPNDPPCEHGKTLHRMKRDGSGGKCSIADCPCGTRVIAGPPYGSEIPETPVSYWLLISDGLMAEIKAHPERLPACLTSLGAPVPAPDHPGMKWHLFQDTEAPRHLDGQHVELTMSVRNDLAHAEPRTVIDRREVIR